MCETQLLFGLLVRPGPISVFEVLYASKNSVSTWEKCQRRYFRADSSKTLSWPCVGGRARARIRFFRRLVRFGMECTNVEDIVRIKNNHDIH